MLLKYHKNTKKSILNYVTYNNNLNETSIILMLLVYFYMSLDHLLIYLPPLAKSV